MLKDDENNKIYVIFKNTIQNNSNNDILLREFDESNSVWRVAHERVPRIRTDRQCHRFQPHSRASFGEFSAYFLLIGYDIYNEKTLRSDTALISMGEL